MADSFCRYVGAVVLQATYGYEVKGDNDFYINLAHTAMQSLIPVVHAGSYLVEFAPILKLIPGELISFSCHINSLLVIDVYSTQNGFLVRASKELLESGLKAVIIFAIYLLTP